MPAPLPIRGPRCLWCDSDLPATGDVVCPGCGREVRPHNPARSVGELADLMRETGAVIVLCATPHGYALAFARPGAPVSVAQFRGDSDDAEVDPIEELLAIAQTWPKPGDGKVPDV